MDSRPTDPNAERVHLPVAAPPTNHGHTLAAWVTVGLVILGGVAAALGMIAPLPWLVWTGFGIIAVGLVVGRVLKMLGFGQTGGDAGRTTRTSGSAAAAS